MPSCQRCRQPIQPSSLPAPSSRPRPAPHLAQPAHHDSHTSLGPSTYELLTQSERIQGNGGAGIAASGGVKRVGGTGGGVLAARQGVARVPAGLRPLYDVATRQGVQPNSAIQRVVVPSPSSKPSPTAVLPRSGLGPTESFVVLTDSVFGSASAAALPAPGSAPRPAASSSDPFSSPAQPTSLTPHLSQLSALYTLLSSQSSLTHPLCTECTESLLTLMTRELDELRKEKDRLAGFEKEVGRKREEVRKSLGVATDAEVREALEKEIAKLRKAESHAITELKAVEAQKASLAEEQAALDAEEEELAREEAEFWRQHSLYVLDRDDLLDRQSALKTRLANGQRELDKLQRTNVYNDAFCIGQEAGFGTINGLRLGRLPGIAVEWPEINAAWGHTLLLLHTIARKFAFEFQGYKLVPCGSFSSIEKVGEKGETGGVYELYGSGDFAVTRLLQNRRFDMAMVAFLECLRQLSEYVTRRDRGVRLPHAVVKDRIGDVSIKLQFGSDETWTRALRHVLLDLKILLSRASL
ncbi:Vacuolar protein sorting-associated protein atg6 [Rhodotorula toruloides]